VRHSVGEDIKDRIELDIMSINTNELRALPPDEKLRLVEFLWDDLGAADVEIPLPNWVDLEATRRRQDMRDPDCGLSHDEAWERINRRNG
jgi:putative addiction module component (TIGR02574 family)